MRTEEIDKWVQEGGDLPQELTEDEKAYLTKLGWTTMVMEYLNGQKEFERHYLHGKKHGKWEWCLSNGQKDYERHYLHGKPHGKHKGWWNNGQKYFEYHYFHGMKHGVLKEWDKDGTLTKGHEYFYGNKIK